MTAEGISELLAAGKAAEERASDPTALAAFARALLEMDRFEEAMRVAKHATRLASGSPASLAALEVALDAARATQHPALAAAEARAVRAAREGDLGLGVEWSLAEIAADQGRLDEAIAILSASLARAPACEEDGEDAPRHDAEERLEEWRTDATAAQRARARAAGLRGDHGEVVRAYDAIGRGATEDDVDALFRIDALIAGGDADLAVLAFEQDVGSGVITEPAAFVAGARAILASGGPLADGLELAHRVALGEGARRHEADVRDLLCVAAERPLAEWEAVHAALRDLGARSLAARVAADARAYVAGAKKSKVLRAGEAARARAPVPAADVAATLAGAAEERAAYEALARGDAATAEPLFARAVGRTGAPHLAAAWSTAAEEALAPDDALDVHWIAARVAPYEAAPHRHLALHLLRRGHRDAGVDAAIAAFEVTEGDDLDALRAALGPAWKKARVPFPLDPDAADAAGDRAYDDGSFALAARCYAFCFAWAEDDQSAFDAARSWAALGDTRATVRAACHLHGDGGPTLAGALLRQSGRLKEAVHALRWGARAFPARATLDALAGIAWAVEDVHTAAWAWGRAAAPEWSAEAFGPGNISCFAWALLRTGDVDGAERWQARLAERFTDTSNAAWGEELAAAVCLARADWKGALGHAKRAHAVHPRDAQETLDRAKRRDPYPVVAPPRRPPLGGAWEAVEARREKARAARGAKAPAVVAAPAPLEPAGGEIATAGFRAADLDARGLLPLERARRIVRDAAELRRGEGRMIGGSFVLDSDILWAALLSLEDADELVREARRLVWFFHPRGHDNVWLVRRYGDGILPWLADHVDARGVLHDVPWCVRPCLLAIGTEQAGEVVLRVRARAAAERFDVPGPYAAHDPGDVDRRPPPIEEKDEELARAWVTAHPDVGLRLLARQAAAGDARAGKLLAALAPARPERAFAAAKAALGEAGASRLFERSRLPRALSERAILTLLDEHAEGRVDTPYMPWPTFNTDIDGRCEYHGMRLVAARARHGDGWGVVIERITGCDQDGFAVEVFRYGSEVAGGMDVDLGRDLDVDFGDPPDEERPDDFGLDLDLRVIWGAGGPLVVSPELLETCDLRPGATTEDDSNASSSLLLRAYLAAYPHAFWSPPAEAAAVLGLGDDPEVVVASTAFEHALGTEGGAAESDHDASWCRPPSASKTYRSLASALVTRDGKRFAPGASNLDWRIHAIHGAKKKRKRTRSHR